MSFLGGAGCCYSFMSLVLNRRIEAGLTPSVSE